MRDQNNINLKQKLNIASEKIKCDTNLMTMDIQLKEIDLQIAQDKAHAEYDWSEKC